MINRREGKIIHICSMQSELGRDTITPYAGSKGSVKMLVKGMCVELARYAFKSMVLVISILKCVKHW